MTNRKIYEAALALLAENKNMGESDDYEESAPYIIAAFCCDAAESDRKYRRAYGLSAPQKVNDVYLSLDAEFPCCERFNTAAVMYVAAMLIIDDNTELSDNFFDKYSDTMSDICFELPAAVERVSNRYGFS